MNAYTSTNAQNPRNGQSPEEMTFALFDAQFQELQRARAIRNHYHTDVVLGLTSAIRVLLIDMPELYKNRELLNFLHIVVEEARFRSAHKNVKFHVYKTTLPPMERKSQDGIAPKNITGRDSTGAFERAGNAQGPAIINKTTESNFTSRTKLNTQAHKITSLTNSPTNSPTSPTSNPTNTNSPTTGPTNSPTNITNRDTTNSPVSGPTNNNTNSPTTITQESTARKKHNSEKTSKSKITRTALPFAEYLDSTYAPIFVEPHIYAVHPLLLWAQMAVYLALEELVVLGDAMMRRSYYHVHVAPDDFRSLLDSLPSTFPHRKKCEKAVTLLAENTDSCMESRLRFRLTKIGFGPFAVNYRLTLNTYDHKTAFLDIAIPDLKIAIEYSGKFHSGQWSNDEARRTALASAGWQVLSVSVETLRNPKKFKDFVLQLSATIARQQSKMRGG